MKSFSYGETPRDVIVEAVRSQCPNGYPMTIRSQNEWSAIAAAVNVGIDSHLEAIVSSTFDSSTGECLVSAEDMPILLRRLDDTGDVGMSLRNDILYTLEIEEI